MQTGSNTNWWIDKYFFILPNTNKKPECQGAKDIITCFNLFTLLPDFHSYWCFYDLYNAQKLMFIELITQNGLMARIQLMITNSFMEACCIIQSM